MENLSLIACVNLDYAIGSKKSNSILYKIFPDLKRFKELTTGHIIVMGMNTFKSLGCKPLPNRFNFVLSHDPEIREDLLKTQNLKFSGFEMSIEDSLNQFQEKSNNEIFIIGGAQIYEQTLHLCNKMYLTMVYDRIVPKEDLIYFPTINFSEWDKIEVSEIFYDEKSDKKYSFTTYQRKKS
jgi:dihydrofolate reductase